MSGKQKQGRIGGETVNFWGNDKRCTILMVEKNVAIQEYYNEYFYRKGYKIIRAGTVKQANDLMDEFWCDVLVSDITMPDGNGVELCRDIKSRYDIPVLFLSKNTEDRIIIESLRAGGDDFIAKPCDRRVLLARIEVLLKNYRLKTLLRFGAFSMNLLSLQVFINGCDLRLTQKEFSLLLLLLQNNGKILSQEFIYLSVWGQHTNNDLQALYTSIYRLKAKLKKGGNVFEISSVRPLGYCLAIKKTSLMQKEADKLK